MRLPLLVLATVLLLTACDPVVGQQPADQGRAELTVHLNDLPDGIAGAVTVTGAEGFSEQVTETTTLEVESGTYRLSAAEVRDGEDNRYLPTLDTEQVVIEEGHAQAATVSYYTVIPSTTEVLEPDQVGAVEGAAGDVQVVTVSGAAAVDLVVGDVLAIGSGLETPDGLLGEVTAVDDRGESVVVTVMPATLFQAVTRGRFDIKTALEPADIASVPEEAPTSGGAQSPDETASDSHGPDPDPGSDGNQPGPGSTVPNGVEVIPSSTGTDGTGESPAVVTALSRSASAPEYRLVSAVSKGFNHSVSSRELSCEAGPNVTVAGDVGFEPSFALSADWGFFELNSARFSATGAVTSSLSMTGEAGPRCELKPTALLAQPIRLTPIVVYVGPVPVVFTPTVNFMISGKAQLQAVVSAGVSMQSRATVGLAYDDGQFTPIGEQDTTFAHRPVQVAGGLAAEATLGPRLQLLAYGIAGPAATLGGELDLVAVPAQDPWWTLDGCLQGGAALVIPQLKLSHGNDQLIEFCERLAEADQPAPGQPPQDPPPGQPPQDEAPPRPQEPGTVTTIAADEPQDVALDAAGNIYIAESYRIRKISQDGTETTYVGDTKSRGLCRGADDSLPSLQSCIGSPEGLAFDEAGRLHFTAGGQVYRVSSDNVITVVAGRGVEFEGNRPNYCPDQYTGEGGSATAACLGGPEDVGFDGAGNLYIADTSGVRKVTPAGTITTVYAGKCVSSTVPCSVEDIAVDQASGDLYIIDTGELTRVAPDGTMDVVVVAKGAASAEVRSGVAVDRSGTVYYVADSFRVHRLNRDGSSDLVRSCFDTCSYLDLTVRPGALYAVNVRSDTVDRIVLDR